MNTRLLIPLTACLATLPTTAAERFWDAGDVTANWTAAANWNGNAALNLATDDLNFPAGLALADKTVNNNYAANTVFRNLNFLDGGYTVNGTIMGITDGVTGYFAAGSVAINAGFTLQNDQTFIMDGGGVLNFGASSQIYLNGQTLTLLPVGSGSSISINGLLSGSGTSALRISRGIPGGGRVYFNGARTFTAGITIENAGFLEIDNAGGLGAGAGDTRIVNGSLSINSPAALSIPESLKFSPTGQGAAAIISYGGAHTLSGPMMFTENGRMSFFVEGTSLTCSGAITASTNPDQQVTKSGPGRLTLSGAGSNTVSYNFFAVQEGELLLNKSGGASAMVADTLNIGNTPGSPSAVSVKLGASNQISDTAAVKVLEDGVIDLNGHQDTIRRLDFIGQGTVTANGGTLRLNDGLSAARLSGQPGSATITGAVTLGGANSGWHTSSDDLDVTVNGSVSSLVPGGLLTKTGIGTLRINGNVSIPLLEVAEGHLALTGTSPATDLNCHGYSASLTGTVGDVTVTDGIFHPGSFIDHTRQTVNCGHLTMGSGSAYFLATVGVAATDATIVTGTVTLDQPALGVPVDDVEADPLIGEELVIIQNDGTDPVIGNFAGYPEGEILTNFPSEKFVVSYKGGDGNDVSLTRIIPPTGVTRLWDGGGADNNWMTANNWSPNGQPQPGDALVFPTVAARKGNTNNFPAGTTFQSLTVHGTGYGFGGNGITLNEKVEYTSATGSHFLSLPLTLALDATISLTGNGFIQATSPINLNGHKLTLHNAGGGDGDLYISGDVTGTGKVWKTGTGRITFFEQPNSYFGPTSVLEGTLALKADATLGATGAANSTTIHSGATLLLRNNEGAVLLTETLILHDGSTITDNGGTFYNTIGGSMQLLSGTATLRTSSAITYIGSTITGAGGLRKNGSGIVRFFGAQPNTFTGGFFAEEGRVLGAKSNGPAFPGPVTVGASGLYPALEFEADNQIGDNATVRVAETGALRVMTFSDTIGSLTIQGGFVTPATGTLTLQTGVLNVEPSVYSTVTLYCNIALPPGITGQFNIANGNASDEADLAFDGIITGGAVEQSGSGTMTWYHDMPGGTLGALKIKSGISIMHGQCPALPVTLAGGTLAGKGRVASITTLTSGGLLPGEDIGVFNNTRFLSAGTVTLNAATTCRFKLDGLNPGSEYNQLFPSTSLTLGGAALDLTCTCDPAPGDSFMIIRSSTGVPPTGTFAGIPQNGYVSTVGAKVFQVDYAGGDGDDVVLTRVDPTAPEITEYSVTPGIGDNIGYNEIHIGVKGMPGLTYLLESSTNLQTWTAQGSKSADLLTGLISYDLLMDGNLPRLFFRARLP